MPKIEPTLSKPILYHKEPGTLSSLVFAICSLEYAWPRVSAWYDIRHCDDDNQLLNVFLSTLHAESESKIPFVADQSDPESVPKPESNESEGEAEGGGAEAEGAEAEGGAKAESN